MNAIVRRSFYWLALAACCCRVGLAQSNESDEDPFADLVPCDQGHCVELHLCVNNTITTDGADVIGTSLRFAVDLEKNPNEVCEEFLKKCCQHLATSTKVTTTTQRSSPPTPEDTTEVVDVVFEPPPSCGNGYPQGYIYHVKNSGVAQYAEYPWMAGLYGTKNGELEYFCGGSLIHPQMVMTAAHCLRNFSSPDGITVRLGDWDAVNTNEPHKHQDFTVRKIITHEQFNQRNFQNNIVLLVLSKPAPLGKNIHLICLPNADDSFDGRRCAVTGWGKDSRIGKYEGVLKKVELPVVERKACQKMLRQTVLGPIFQLHRSFMCAGGEKGVDACKGDGGSPLMCSDPSGQGYVQAGIVAWGIGCGEKDVPGVYVNVARFVEWIHEKMVEEGFAKDPQPL